MDKLNIERLKMAMDTSENGFWDWNLDTNEIFFSDRYFEMLGYKPDELPMSIDTWVKLLHPDDKEKIAEKLVKKVKNAEPFDTEFRLKCKDGSYKWISGKGKAYEKDENDVPHRAAGVHLDITSLKEAQEHINYQNSVLKAIRNVNQLITKEKIEKKLIKKVCDILVESRGFFKAWIVLFDENGKYITSANSNYDGVFLKMTKKYENNELPICAKKAIKTRNLIITENTKEECDNCPISNLYIDRGAYTIALSYEGKIYGVLSVSVPKKYIREQEEQILFNEVSSDISFALHNLKREKEIKKSQEALVESENKVRKKLNAILSSNENLSNLELSDILDIESIQILMDNLNEIFDTTMAILDVNGKVLVKSKWQDICTKFHRINPDTAKNCLESDTILTKGVKKGEFKEYKCKNNMYDISTPIILGGKHLGNIFVGQFLYLDEEINYDLFREQAKNYGFDEKEYIKALKKIPRRSREFIKNIMTFYANFSNMIASMGYNNLMLARKINEEKEIRKKLQESDAQKKALLDATPDVIVLMDKDFKINWINKAAEKLNPDAVGKKCYEAFASTDEICKDCPALKALQSGRMESGIKHHTSINGADGESYWEDTSVPIKNENGNITSLLEIVKNVTDRIISEKEKEEIKERLEMAMDAGEHGFWDWDLDTDEIFFSPRYYTMLGYEPGELPMVKETWVNLMHPDDRKKIVPLVDKFVHEAQPYSVEFRLKCKDGSWKWISGRGKSYERDQNGIPHRAVGSHVDINEIKKAEEKTKKLNKELNNKNAELEQVLYATSHDLRSPLVNVQGFNKELEMSLNELKEITENEKIPDDIKKRLDSILNEEIPESMHYIVTSTSKMDSLLTGLLRISRVGRQKLNKKELDMNELIKEVIENIEYKLKEKKVDVEIEELPECTADSLQMNQLFTNLIENSIKNLSEDRKGKIRIYGSTDDKFINYTVQDNGIGVPENFQNRIFELFYKINPDKSGIGLGLSIVKQIIKKHNGKIRIESEEGKGTKIIFSIPLVSGGE